MDGYGEDSLTYWACTMKVDEILKKLKDPSSSMDCHLYYRPSFGRGGGAKFGEFDAILISRNTIYLIESKWDGLKTQNNVRIKLSEPQIQRHKVFKWYFSNWDDTYREWSKFKEKKDYHFSMKFPGKIIPLDNSILAMNLEYFLRKYVNQNLAIINIVLYFKKNDNHSLISLMDKDFKLILIDYQTTYAGYFDMINMV